jgi:hypothetical protein
MRTVEEREAHAAAVAEAFCKPSELHYAVCPLLVWSHIAISVVGCFASNLQFFPDEELLTRLEAASP